MSRGFQAVQAPGSAAERAACELLAAAVAEHPWVEAAALERVGGGARGPLGFAADACHPAHAYYRLRVLEGALGEGPLQGRVTAVRGGICWWDSPPEGAPEGRGERGALLTPAEARALHRLVGENLTLAHGSVERVTEFALERPWAAAEVVAALCNSAAEGAGEGPPGLCLALVYCAHDILCNTSGNQGPAPRDSAVYLELLREALPLLFEALGEAYRTSPGHMERETLVQRSARVLRMWRAELFFSPVYVLGLLGAILRPPDPAPASAAPEVPEARRQRQLGGCSVKDLQRLCRRLGLSCVGGPEVIAARVSSHERWATGGGGDRWGLGVEPGAVAACVSTVEKKKGKC